MTGRRLRRAASSYASVVAWRLTVLWWLIAFWPIIVLAAVISPVVGLILLIDGLTSGGVAAALRRVTLSRAREELEERANGLGS